MYHDDDILDAPEIEKPKKLLPDTQAEQVVFISAFCFQYFLLLIGFFSPVFEIVSIFLGVILFFGVILMQFFNNISGYFETKDRKRLIYLVLMLLWLPVSLFITTFESVSIMIIAFLMLHALNWFYVYILYMQQKARKKQLILKKEAAKPI
jgi:hypothetical protein